MHATRLRACVCVHALLWVSPCELLCLFSLYDFYLPRQWATSTHACSGLRSRVFQNHVRNPFTQISTTSSISVCARGVCGNQHARRLDWLCCRQGLFGAVVHRQAWIHRVPSWHAPWDNERLCFGLDCWLRIIQKHKQATVRPCVHTWSTLGSRRHGQTRY